VHDPINTGSCWRPPGIGASGGGCGCGATGGSELVALNLVGVLLMAARRTRRKR
jgi:MYXO-CTERM domain-containing protein